MCYYENERPKETQKRVDEYRRAAALFPVIRRVVAQFDGKVFNCRLQAALREAIPRIICEKQYGRLTIYIYELGRQITLASVKIEDMPDGKRIPAALLIENAKKRRESLLKQAADIERYAEQIDIIRGQIKYLEKQLNTIISPIPCDLKDIYRLHYRLMN